MKVFLCCSQLHDIITSGVILNSNILRENILELFSGILVLVAASSRPAFSVHVEGNRGVYIDSSL